MTHLERLASRSMRLLAEGVLPLPTDEKVTIILRSTRPDWTSICLQTIERHTSEHIKVLVVPDNSYEPQFAGIDRFNLALSQVDTHFFVLLDDGIIVTPNWLTRLLWTFYDDSGVGIAGPSANMESDSDFCSSLDELFTLSREIAKRNSGFWEPVQNLRGRCLVCRTALLDEVGGLDYSLQSHEARILDWCWRVKTKGHLLALSKDSVVYELQPVHADSEEENHKWSPFRKKWELAAAVDPYSASGETKHPSLIPLTAETLSPPLVSVVVTSFEPAMRALYDALNTVEQQTYPNIEILLIRQGSPPHLQKSIRTPAAGIWINGQIQIKKLLESIWQLAQGQYIAYLETGYTYEQDHISRLVDSVHRKRAIIGIANTDDCNRIPLSFVMHLHPTGKPVDLDIRFSQNKNMHLILNKTNPFEVVKIPEKTVKRRVKS